MKLQAWDRDSNEECFGPFKFVLQAPSRFLINDQRAESSNTPASSHTSSGIPSTNECTGPPFSTVSRTPTGFQAINKGYMTI